MSDTLSVPKIVYGCGISSSRQSSPDRSSDSSRRRSNESNGDSTPYHSRSPSPNRSQYAGSDSHHSSSHSSVGSSGSGVRRAVEVGRRDGAQVSYIDTGLQHNRPEGVPDRGYFAVSRKGSSGNIITVHNTGGTSRGAAVVDLGPYAGNGAGHSEECRRRSRMSDARYLCYCIPAPQSMN